MWPWCWLLQMTSPQWQNLEQREAYQRLIETVSVLHRLATRLSSRAEIVGAVRQVPHPLPPTPLPLMDPPGPFTDQLWTLHALCSSPHQKTLNTYLFSPVFALW